MTKITFQEQEILKKYEWYNLVAACRLMIQDDTLNEEYRHILSETLDKVGQNPLNQ